VQDVLGLAAHREGRRVGPSNDDCAGPPQAPDLGAVLGGDQVAVRLDAVVGGEASLIGVHLGGDRQAVQRADRLASPQRAVGGIGLGERLLVQDTDDGVESWVDGVEPIEVRGHRLARRDLAGPDQCRQRHAVELPQFARHTDPFSVRHPWDRRDPREITPEQLW